MAIKSRSNWQMGMCLDSCECKLCRGEKNRTVSRFEHRHSVGIGGCGIVVNTHFAPDGSILDRPMSQTYIEHVRGRRKDNLHKLKKNMGAYGA